MGFEEWFSSHLSWLLRLATSLAGRDLAEELVQDTAMKVHRRWGSVSELDHPKAYVRRMLVNEHLSWRRRWGRVTVHDATLFDRASGEPGPGDRIADRSLLAGEIKQLPPKQRAVIVLRYLEGLDDAAIADVLGCGQSTVRSHATRALAALRVQLTDSTGNPAPMSQGSPTSQENSHAH